MSLRPPLFPSGSPRTRLPDTLAPGLLPAFSVAVALSAFPVLAATAAPLGAQEGAEEAQEWDVTRARGETRTIDFTTDEGTWMSVDVSPDGEWLVFDLLAHVYRVPIEGGEAEPLTQESGVALNYHPQVSPDGRFIAFVSDRSGQSNLWVMDADGSNPRQVQESRDTRVTMPTWGPESTYIYVAQSGGIWMYHRDGGAGVEVVSSEGGSASWPDVSDDGRYLYYHVRTPGQTVPWASEPGGGASAAADASVEEGLVRDVLQGAINLRRMDLETGEMSRITAGTPSRQYRLSSGGAYAGELSPDGRTVAFARRLPDATIEWKGHEFGPSTALWLRDLETGEERIAMDPISQDQAEGMKILRVLPGYSWHPDGRTIVLSQGGKLRRLDTETGEVSTIPFTARVQRTISEQAYRAFEVDDGPVPVRFLRWTTASPSGDRLAFQAVGRVWVQDLPAGAPRTAVPDDFPDYEYAPAWSPDGRWLAFVSVDESGDGHLWKVPAGGGEPQRLTQAEGEYMHPVWSPDGSEILLVRGAGATARYRTMAHNPWFELVVVPQGGGDARRVTRVEGPTLPTRTQFVRPSFGPGDRIYFPEMGEDGTSLVSVDRDGESRRVHLTLPYADEIQISPDGRWAAFNEGDNVFLVPVPGRTGGGAVPVEKDGGKLPVRALSAEGGIFPGWRSDGVVEFGSGSRYFAHDVAAETTDTVAVSLTVPRRSLAAGSIALTGARIVTLEDREVIESGVIVATDGRIACIGEVGACDTAGADRTVDVSGKTIIPGFVDMHSHFFREYRGIIPEKAFEAAVPLAYGVTTNLDNSQWSQDVFPAAEMIEAGVLLGPRTYSTGDPLYRGDGPRQNELTSYEVAADNVDRLQSWGAVSLKSYMQPRRQQRQWVTDVARDRGLMVTGEGSDLHYNLGLIMDGQTAWEHPLSYVPMYSDAARFFGQAKTVYSPTFVVGGPGPWNDEYFLQEEPIWRKEKLRMWFPWKQLVQHTRRVYDRPVTDYSYPMLAQVLADIMAEGGHGAIGAHGQQHGLASHWEVWMAAEGLGNHGALELASREGAYFLGALDDLGTLAEGKLADLIVLDANPLDDIRNTERIRYVMKGGVLWDGTTLDELWPRERPYGERPWLHEEVYEPGARDVHRFDDGGN